MSPIDQALWDAIYEDPLVDRDRPWRRYYEEPLQLGMSEAEAQDYADQAVAEEGLSYEVLHGIPPRSAGPYARP